MHLLLKRFRDPVAFWLLAQFTVCKCVIVLVYYLDCAMFTANEYSLLLLRQDVVKIFCTNYKHYRADNLKLKTIPIIQ